jgi:DNA-binding NtrC family response regulator
LIYGESGTGKELVARALHAASLRSGEPFVEVNCAAIPEELIESELFGHVRGSFTGASETKEGKFQKADNGTLFLDEVGDMSLRTQAKVLRVLEEQRIEPVGSNQASRVDVRVLAATNKKLDEQIARGLFREDLFYRLSTITLDMPPLRERRSDVDLLAKHFATVLNDRFGFRKRIGEEALDVLRRHDWPGNVRELLHVVEAAMIVCEGDEILPEHLPLSVRGSSTTTPLRDSQAGDTPLLTLDAMERAHIERAIQATGGHRGHAAKMLGISERNLYRKLREYGLPE